MNTTLELIKAKQNAAKAEEDLKQALKKASEEARARHFNPLREILNDVLDAPAKDYAWHSSHKTISVREHIGRSEGLIPDTHYWVTFKTGGYSSGGLHIEANDNGLFDTRFKDDLRRKNISLEEAKEELIAKLASIIIQ
jgi:hypothetical protein